MADEKLSNQPFDNNDSVKYFVPSLEKYFSKMAPSSRCTVNVPPLSESIWGFSGAIISIGIICYLSYIKEVPILIASFGASAVLLYGVPAVPLAQPRNVFGGHIIAAIVGVCIYQLFGNYWFTAAASTAITIAIMIVTRTVHPPAGATVLVAVTTGQDWSFIILPVGVGVVILILVAVLVNNLAQKRSYPTYWW